MQSVVGQDQPWGRGTGEGIGLSGHKNEFSKGTRIGNWVEDLHQAEAGRGSTQGGGQNRMRYFVEAEEAHRLSLAFVDKSRNQRQEPNMGLSGNNLFSHGPKPGMVFGASMANLHYKNPADCTYGAASGDRVYKSMFYGSKHIDQYVPKTDPNAHVSLMEAKQGEWTKQHPQARPTNAVDMYKTTALAHSTAYKGEKYGVSRLGGM